MVEKDEEEWLSCGLKEVSMQGDDSDREKIHFLFTVGDSRFFFV